MARPCAARSAALAGWTPREAPACPLKPVLNNRRVRFSVQPGGLYSAAALFEALEKLMAADGVDYTILWRQLYRAAKVRAEAVAAEAPGMGRCAASWWKVRQSNTGTYQSNTGTHQTRALSLDGAPAC